MKEKIRKSALFASITAGIAAIVFGILDIANVMKNAYTYANFLFAAFLGLYAVSTWNENRKMAIFDLVLAIVLLIVAVATIHL